MRPDRAVYFRSAILLCALILLAAALLVSDGTIERALVSDPYRSLSWGPALFRVLLGIHGFVLLFVALHLRKRDRDSAASAARPTAETTLSDQEATTRHAWLALTLMSVFALSLRLWHLNTDLWFDELLTLLSYVRLPLGDIVTSLPDQNNHILYSVLAHASVQIFGESAWAVRLPSVIFGVLSLWALFLLGRRIVGTREALAACTLMTVSYHHIWFSQNARGYVALLFFSLLATWLWLEARSRASWGWWLAYSLAVTAGMLSHLTMVFVVIAHVLVHLVTLAQERRDNKDAVAQFDWKPFIAWMFCASFTLQCYALALPEFLRVGLHEVSRESEWTNPWWVVLETLRNLRIGFSGILVVLCGGVMIGLGWLSLLRRRWQMATLLVLPALLAGGTMFALGHNLWPRFFFFSMGFALLIAVHGAMVLPQLFTGRFKSLQATQKFSVRAGLVLVSLMIAASAATVPRNYAHPKQDYTGARDYVESRRQARDAVVAVGLAGVAYGRYFAPGWSVAQTTAELNAARLTASDVWVVYTLPVEVKAYRPEVWREIQQDFQVVRVFPGTLGGGEVFVCRQRARNRRIALAESNTKSHS